MVRLVMAMVMLVRVNIKVILKFKIKVIIKFKIKIILITQAVCFYKYLVNEEEKKLANNKKKKKYLVQEDMPPLSHLHVLQPSPAAKEIRGI